MVLIEERAEITHVTLTKVDKSDPILSIRYLCKSNFCTWSY